MPGEDPIQRLRDIEEAIAMTDRQRLLVMGTTGLAVETVLRQSWGEIKEALAITEMITRRMFNHCKAQKELKKQIGLSIVPSMSGIFQQAVGTYLRAYLETVGQFQVHLDKQYDGHLRPDIAVERNSQRLAAIEVKTDLGWNRDYIATPAEPDSWANRKDQCKNAQFEAVYLLILANSNWPGFKSGMERQGVRVLLRTSPNNVKFKWYQDEQAPLGEAILNDSNDDGEVIHPIEALFEEVSHLS
jgi:hypothetical protein